MRPRLDRPAVVCTAAVSLVTAVAGLAPSPARADDVLQTQVPAVGTVAASVTDATAGALATVPTDATEAVEALPGVEPSPPADETTTTEPSAQPTGAAPSPEPEVADTPDTP